MANEVKAPRGRGMSITASVENLAATVPGAKIRIVDVGQSYENLSKQFEGGSLLRLHPGWFEKAIYETSAKPRGCFKQAWTMRLLRSGSRCRLPRGFFKGRKAPVFVGAK